VLAETAKYQASNFNASTYIFQNGRMNAIGYDAGINYKAHLWVVDNTTGTIVKIEARSTHTTLPQLVAMGASLKQE
jgi:hypothetical protein